MLKLKWILRIGVTIFDLLLIGYCLRLIEASQAASLIAEPDVRTVSAADVEFVQDVIGYDEDGGILNEEPVK